VSPLRGEKPQNWPLSKLNTGRFALRAMLPVKNEVLDFFVPNLGSYILIFRCQCYYVTCFFLFNPHMHLLHLTTDN